MKNDVTELITKAVKCESTQRIKAAIAAIDDNGTNQQQGPRKFHNVKGIMEQCGGLSRTKIWKMRKAGMPSYKVGSRILFKADECEDWIRKNQ